MRTAKKDAPAAAPVTTEKTPDAVTAPVGKLGDANSPPPGEDIEGGDVDEVIKLDEGEAVEVLYKGYKETKSTKPGEVNRLHKLVMADGVARGLWGTLQLNAMLDKCETGDKLWIAYLGKEEIPGGKTMHNWKVVRTARQVQDRHRLSRS